MKYILLSGSHSANSQTEKVTQWLADALTKRGHTTELISLADNPFPLWDASFWNESSDLYQQLNPVLQKFHEADGFVIATPEWNGMAAPALKNFFLYLSDNEVGHKPALLVSVSSGRGGAYPISELRESSYKNTRITYIPEHLIVRNVQNVMNDHDVTSGDSEDIYIKKRALFTLDVLETYTEKFQGMHTDSRLRNTEFEHGM